MQHSQLYGTTQGTSVAGKITSQSKTLSNKYYYGGHISTVSLHNYLSEIESPVEMGEHRKKVNAKQLEELTHGRFIVRNEHVTLLEIVGEGIPQCPAESPARVIWLCLQGNLALYTELD